jgi:hypothetical protein
MESQMELQIKPQMAFQMELKNLKKNFLNGTYKELKDNKI